MITAAQSQTEPFYIGTYGKASDNQGIWRSTLDTKTGKLSKPELAAAADNAGFVAITPDNEYLYAAVESGDASMAAAYKVEEGGKLSLINQQPSGGKGTCHVWLAPGYVFVANYGGGSAACFVTNPDGALGERTSLVSFTGSGPNPKRQQRPYGHSVITDPELKFAYICDLGSDNVWSYRFDRSTGTLTPTDPPSGRPQPGAGPRHSVMSTDGKYLYVNGEMDLTLNVFSRDPAKGTLSLIQTEPLLPVGTNTENVTSSGIQIHPSGRWIYVSNRVHDSISVFAVGDDGKVTFVENVPALVQVPRAFGIDPTGQWLITAGQKDGKLAVLKIDPATGRLTATDHRADVLNPSCVTFVNPTSQNGSAR